MTKQEKIIVKQKMLIDYLKSIIIHFAGKSFKDVTIDLYESELASLESEPKNGDVLTTENIEHIFKNTQRIHGNSESIDWIKVAAHKCVSYAQSRPKPTDEEIEEWVDSKYSEWLKDQKIFTPSDWMQIAAKAMRDNPDQFKSIKDK